MTYPPPGGGGGGDDGDKEDEDEDFLLSISYLYSLFSIFHSGAWN